MEVKNYLLGFDNMYIYQDSEMFNFSLDSVLLAQFVTINKNINKILDIGCGNAPIPLILSTRTRKSIIGVEIQPEVYLLAKKSVSLNNLDEQITIINEDINEYYKKVESDTFDVITCNPPFFKLDEKSLVSNSKYKSLARHEHTLSISQVFIIAKKLLKNNGIIAIVQRPERLIEIIEEMKKNNIEPKIIQFIYPKENMEANMVLIEGRKNGRTGLKILPPFYVHLANGEYTLETKKLFERK